MLLCLDVGNTQLFGGLFVGNQNDTELKFRFRFHTRAHVSSDELGIFLCSVLRENHIDPLHVNDVAICSVVPAIDYSLRAACIKYFKKEPFILRYDCANDLTIVTADPATLGADLLATAIGAAAAYPQQDILIADFGTATTFTAVNKQKQLLGTIIQPGIRTCMEALSQKASLLFPVEIKKPSKMLESETAACIQSGLYYGQLAMIKSVYQNCSLEVFSHAHPVFVGTGGFAHLFEEEKVFTAILPDLILQGLHLAYWKFRML